MSYGLYYFHGYPCYCRGEKAHPGHGGDGMKLLPSGAMIVHVWRLKAACWLAVIGWTLFVAATALLVLRGD